MTTNRILVVDDDSSLRRVMKMQLEEAGYEVALAPDGDQAFAMLQELQPRLVITDLRMPTSGMELLRRIAGGNIETTVIVVTAFATIETALLPTSRGSPDSTYSRPPRAAEWLLVT